MSVSYGRYIISYDSQERMWNADPKCLKLLKNKETFEYSYPRGTNGRPLVFVESSRSAIADSMRKHGCKLLTKRRNEWVVQLLNDNPVTNEGD